MKVTEKERKSWRKTQKNAAVGEEIPDLSFSHIHHPWSLIACHSHHPLQDTTQEQTRSPIEKLAGTTFTDDDRTNE